ncbi:putative protein phosphatase 2C [Arachis hypogaea]|nr:putative protein phosphatase 2C [Arachis hypogaea]
METGKAGKRECVRAIVSPSEEEEREPEPCKGGAERAQGRSHHCRRILPPLPLLRSPSSSSLQAESPPSMVEPRRESAQREETDGGGVRREEGVDVYVTAAKSHHRCWSLWPSGPPFLPPLMKLIGVARRLLSLYLVLLEAALLRVWLSKTDAGTPVFLIGWLDGMQQSCKSLVVQAGIFSKQKKMMMAGLRVEGGKVRMEDLAVGVQASDVTMEDFYDIKTLKIGGHSDDGSTVSTAVLVDNHLYVANVGDSGTIILKAGKAIALLGS